MNGDRPAGERWVAGYALGRCIHRSARAQVFEARLERRRYRIDLFDVRDENTETRLAAMSSVRSEHVVSITELGVDKPSGELFVVTPWWDCASLDTLLDRYAPFDSAAAVRLARQLAAGLEALHDAGVVHGDLTPANILMVELEDGRLIARIGLPDCQTTELPLEESVDRRALGDILDRGCAGADETPRELANLISRLRQVDPLLSFRDDGELVDALSAMVVEGTDLYQDELPGAARARAPAQEEPDEATYIPIGTIVGERYELLKHLGRGGMGDVYEARDPDGHPVAVKLIRADASRDDDDIRRRFLREARTAGLIDSDHVVGVLAVGSDAALGYPFLVMELLTGEDLGQVVKRLGPLAPDEAVRIVVDATRGLTAAHRQGLIHRDIKPGNVFLHECDGAIQVKLCDFGIVKRTAVLAEHASTQLTRSGGLLGSPLYMSPEQAQNAKEADARSDVWSMSVTLYEALTGKSPWADCDTIGQVLLRLYTQDVPSVRKLAPWVDPSLAKALHRGLERDPAKRYDSAQALLHALEPFARNGPLRPHELRGVDAHEADAAQRPIGSIAARGRLQLLVLTISALALGTAAWFAVGNFDSAPSGAPTASASAPAPPPAASEIPTSMPVRLPTATAAATNAPEARSAQASPPRHRPREARSAEPSLPSPAASTRPGPVPSIEREW